MHIHPEQDESYEVLSGTLDLYMNKQWKSLGPGESFYIPKGSVHGFRNSTDEVVWAVNIHNPGLRFLESLEEMERLRATQIHKMYQSVTEINFRIWIEIWNHLHEISS